jgi:hypothetical protein
LLQFNGIQLIEKQGEEFQLPIMCRSNKINVPVKGAIKGMKMSCHGSIPKASNAIQLKKCSLKGSFSTPQVMPKTNLAREIILPNASITMRNSCGDKGSPCLKPHELLKKPMGEPFTNTEKRTDETQWAIQDHFPLIKMIISFF